MASRRKHTWSCGHSATGECSECFRLLRLKANAMVELVDDMLADAEQEQRERFGKRLADILHGRLGTPTSSTDAT